MRRSLRSALRRAGNPFLRVLDRRFRDLAERIERHTTSLADDQARRLQQVDERMALDVRVVDEHLHAIRRATRRAESPLAPVTDELAAVLDAALGSEHPALVVVAPPGQPFAPIPDGYEVAQQLAFRADDERGWVRVPSGEDPTTLRVLRLVNRAPG